MHIGRMPPKLTALLIPIILTSVFYIALSPAGSAQSTAKIRVINPSTGNENFTYFTNVTHTGDRFNATIWVYNVTDLYSYQIMLTCNLNVINATRAWIPEGDGKWVFYNKNSFPTPPVYWVEAINGTDYCHWKLGSTLLGQETPYSGNGTLAIVEFEVLAYPAPDGRVEAELLIDNDDTCLLKDPWTSIPAEKTNGRYSLIWLEPTLAIKPAIRIATDPNETINIDIWVEDVTESDMLVAFSFILTYNSTLLNLTNVLEGPFLPSFNNTSNPPYTNFTYTLTSNSLSIQSKLNPNVDGQFIQFPKGSGILSTLQFKLTQQPLNITECPLQLINVTLLNPEEKPMTIGPPESGLIIITSQIQPYLQIIVEPKIASIGSTININGTLFPEGDQINITIYIRPNTGKWSKLTTVNVKNGSFLYKWKAMEVGSFELKANCTKAESDIIAVNITKAWTEITISVGPSSAEIGSRIKICGVVHVKSKVNVTLYYRMVGHSPQELAILESDDVGNYCYEWVPETTGAYEIYAQWPGNETFFSTTSLRKTIVIEKHSLSIILQIHPTTVLRGSEVKINGTVNPSRSGLDILIFYREVNGTFWSNITARTDGSGKFNVVWIAPKNATFEFYAWWRGDEYTKPCSSNLVLLEINGTIAQPPGQDYTSYIIMAILLLIGLIIGTIYYTKIRGKRVSKPAKQIKIVEIFLDLT